MTASVPRGRRWSHLLAAVLFFVGAGLCNCFLTAMYPRWAVFAAAALCSAVWALSGLAASRRSGVRTAGLVATAALLGLYAFWLYLAVAFLPQLAWTVPAWMWGAIGAAALLSAADRLGRTSPFQVPFALPLGMLIAALLSGWLREERLVRCDDYLAFSPPAEIVVPSRPDFATCRRGEVRAAGRFPRTIWQDPAGDRVVFTTQGEPFPGGIDGAFCEAELAAGARPHCVGPPVNKSQGLTELPGGDVLLGLQWGLATPAGGRGAAIVEMSRRRPLRILAQHWFADPLGDGFYEPRNRVFYLFSDEMDAIHPVQLPAYTPLAKIAIPFAPGEVRYDMSRGEGVACGSATGAAIRGDPFALRFLAAGSSSLLERVSMTWGCDWDPESRLVYSTVPNLGLLDRIHYDSGAVDQRWYVGFGMRSVEYDAERRRIYFTNFLRGEVVAFDEASGREVGRWFVGRFSRWVRLTPDRRALLATGNLGVVRIPLGAV